MGIMMVVVGVLMGCVWGAVESPRVNFSDPSTYVNDDKVYIRRDTGDEMLLKDDSITSEVRLWTLVNAGGVSDHGGLTGLGDDDHANYYNAARLYVKFGSANAGSGATYNNTLPISGDVAANATLGAHVADDTIHYVRPGGMASVATTGGQFASIQDAVDWLDTNYGGGIVDVAGGTYTEKITLSDNIAIRGTLGATVMQYGTGGNSIITVGGGVTGYIEGIMFRDTNVKDNVRAISNSGTLYVNNCDFYFDCVDATETILSDGLIYLYGCKIKGKETIIKTSATNSEIVNCSVEFIVGGASPSKLIWLDGFADIMRDTIIFTYGATYGVYSDGDRLDMINVRLYESGGTPAVYAATGSDIYTHGCAFDVTAGGGDFYEINEGWVTNKRVNVDKVAGEVDDAYRYRMDSVARFWVDYEGNGYFAGNIQAANFTGGGGGVVTVALEGGGDYLTIQDAVDGITSGVILIYPGVYEEQVTISGDDITLLGVDREKVIIRSANLTNEGVVHLAGLTTGINLQNLTIENTTAFSGKGVALAVVNGTQVTVYDCDLISSGRDTIYIYQGAYETWGKFYSCYIEGGSDVTSCENSGQFYNCRFYINQSGEEAFFINQINGDGVVISNCYFDGAGSNSIGNFNSNDDVLYFYNNTVSENVSDFASTYYWDYRAHTPTVYHTNGSGNMDLNGYLNTTGVIKTGGTERISAAGVGTLTQANVDNIRVDGNVISSTNTNGDIALTPDGTGDTNLTAGDLEIGGTAVIDASRNGTFAYLKSTNNAEWAGTYYGTTAASKIAFYDGSGYTVEITNGGANELQLGANDVFDCYALKIGDTTTIDSSRNGAFAGLSGTSTFGHYYAAVADAGGNVAGCGVANEMGDPYSTTGWMVNAINIPTYITTSADGACCYFSVPEHAGAIISKINVQWQAQGNADGVLLRLVKCARGGGTVAWTVIGAQQTYTDAGAPYDITTSEYDVADETMAASTTYAIEVEAQAVTGVNLFSVGVETSKRIY
jgi:hypothetical protein